ncbi:YadA-like family protein [Croceibacterium ferulae]|uniref:YadA-like family protein n=1 Tax=Croceibacterium ferulae TaxID=1854641 RepID=UPI000EAB4D02|nr:YadA-like family protein [Croceibacterium ferulae]
MGPVITGVAGPLETAVNGLLGSAGSLLGLRPNLNVTGLLTTAASGQPITLQVLGTDGTIIGPSDQCVATSDSIVLDAPAGIAIGGNRISGLGSDAISASRAFHIDSIALGNNALTANGASASIALGANARATAANSIALGTGSQALRGTLAGYSAIGLTAPQYSAGELSVGSAGTLRQITNVAAGTNLSDAATVGQVTGVRDQVAAQVAGLDAVAVRYAGITRDLVTLAGAGGSRITNLGAGSLVAGSTDAVNGAQLFATNEDVAANVASIGDLDTRITTNGAELIALGVRVDNNTTTLAALDNRVVDSTIAIADHDGRIDTNAGAIAALNLAAIQYDGPAKDQITLAGSSGTRITNVSAGTLTASSTDAVNGAQLFAIDEQVAANLSSIDELSTRITVTDTAVARLDLEVGKNTTDLAALDSRVAENSTAVSNHEERIGTNSTAITALSAAAIQYDGGAKELVTLAGAGGTQITNLSAGTLSADSRDAVNGAQLFAISNAFGNLTTQVSAGGLGPVRYADAFSPTTPNGGVPSQSLTLVGATTSPVGLHNLANGAITLGSTEAVTGDQLFTTNNAVGSNTASLSALRTDLNDHGTVLDGAVATLASHGTTLNQFSLAVDRIDIQVAEHSLLLVAQDDILRDHAIKLTTMTTEVSTAKAGIAAAEEVLGTLRVDVGRGLLGPVRYSDASSLLIPNSGSVTNSVVLVGLNEGPVSLGNIARGVVGSGSLDAVNGGQLFALSSQVAAALGESTFDPLSGQAAAFSFRGTTYASVQNVFDAIGSTISTSPVGTGTPIKYFNTTSTMADSLATGKDSIATGPNALASGDASVASGRNARAESLGAVAIGNEAVATGGKSVSIGTANFASGDGAVAIGDPNFATGSGAVALGRDNIATGDGAVALGDTNFIEGASGIALGLKNVGEGLGATLLGRLNTVVGDGSIAVGTSNEVNGTSSIAIGNNNVINGANALAMGSDIQSLQSDTLAVGSSAYVGGLHSAAVGNRAMANDEKALAVGNDAIASAVSTSAFGYAAQASGLEATAVGARAAAHGAYSTAIGRNATSNGFASSSFGLMASSQAYAATALGSGAMALHDGSVALGTASQTVRGDVGAYTAFGLNSVQSSSGEIAIARNISYFDPVANRQTPTGNRQITGLAAGSADTDAVNVAQLKGVANAIGVAVADGFGGGAKYDVATASISGPSYLVNGAMYRNVSDAFGALATQINTGQAAIPHPPTGQQGGSQPDPQLIAQVQALSAQLATLQAQLASLQAAAAGIGGGGLSPAARLSNVADGMVAEGSTDAVNGSQLAAVQRKVGLAVQYEATAHGGPAARVTLVNGADGAGTVIANVAGGAVTVASRDAINGGQLHETNQAIGTVRQTAETALELGQNAVRYDDPSRESVTLAAGGPPVRLRNVAAGTERTDAATVGQLNAGLGQILSEAGAYTDTRVAALSFDLSKVSRRAASGASGAMALASMPQPLESGRSMLSVGVGAYGGEQAVSLGFSGAGEDGHMVAKAGLAFDSMGHVSASAGMGWQF